MNRKNSIAQRAFAISVVVALVFSGTAMGGIPQVINAVGEPYPFRSGDSLTVKVLVKNVGTDAGNFIVQDISCGEHEQGMLYQIYPIAIPSNGMDTIEFKLSPSGSGACSGKVADVGSGQQDSWSFNYQMIAPAQCKGEGQTYWSGGNKIQICKNEQLIDYQSCEFGVIGDGKGGWTCAANPMPNPINKSTTGFEGIIAMAGLISILLIPSFS